VIDTPERRTGREELRSTSESLGNEMKRMRMLLDIISLVSSNWDVPQIFPRISARIRRVMRQEYASFALQDAATGLLVRQAIDFPLGRGFTSDVQIATSSSPSANVLQAHASKIFSKEELLGFDGEAAKSFLAEGLQSLCCVPLLRPSGPLGVFVLGSTRKDAFHTDDLNLLEQVAAQLSIAIENRRAASEIETLKRRLGEEKKYLEGESRCAGEFAEIVGDSHELRQVLDQAATVATSDATVLILGETGTGKELIARAIHRMSPRKDGPFIKVNCAAIPTGLLESELFGHEKGAFTGAVSQKIGRMEMADGGTLFLDEVGEIALELQPKLLRVLQDHEFERLGGNRTIRVTLRLVAATNRQLAKSVARHEFRSDLFYRLSVFPIRIPALRERREDIPLLVRHFVRKYASRMNRHLETIPSGTMKALAAWSWPGNVRELENLMERSVILSEGAALRVPISELRIHPEAEAEPAGHTLDDAERKHIVQTLRKTRGVISGPNGAAKRLGLKRTTLQSKMRRLNIRRSDYSDPTS
jgi:formate hydrogenlyase transcriptional activator